MKRTQFVLTLAIVAFVTQVMSSNAFARSARDRCISKGRHTQQGAVLGGLLGAVTGAVIANNTGNRHVDAGEVVGGGVIGAVAGGVIAHGQSEDACREVEMDRQDRAEARAEARDSESYGDGRVQISPYQFDASFMRSYVHAYRDDSRLRMIEDLAYELDRHGEVIDGQTLYSILIRLDGGSSGRPAANRARALETLKGSVSRLSYREADELDGLFARRPIRTYSRVRSILDSLAR